MRCGCRFRVTFSYPRKNYRAGDQKAPFRKMFLNWYTSTRVVVNRPMCVLTWFHDLQVCRCSLWPFHCFTLPTRVMALRPTWTNRCTYSYIARETLTALSPDQSPALPTQANSNQGFNLDGVGYGLATHLARVGLNFDRARIQFRPTRAKVSTVWPPRPTRAELFCYCMWLCGRSQTIEWFSCELIRLGEYRLCWFWSLARVGLSWECHLTTALPTSPGFSQDFHNF